MKKVLAAVALSSLLFVACERHPVSHLGHHALWEQAENHGKGKGEGANPHGGEHAPANPHGKAAPEQTEPATPQHSAVGPTPTPKTYFPQSS
jgi:hypothetical protein